MQDIVKARKIQALLATSAAAMLIAIAAEARAADETAIPELQAAPQAQTQTQTQTQTEEEKKAEEEEIEQIVVTGSRIRRSELESPAPLTIIDSEAVKLSGENNLADFLSELPALSGSLTPDQQTGASLGLAGLNLLNLRNLGSVRTLVLVNGRRHVAGDPGSAAVDIGTLPFALVERVEVITGGASAIYGADAVSGVVNFIIRDDFQGLNLDAQYAPQDNRGSAGDSYRFSAVAGGNFADGKGNATLAIEWRESNGLDETDIDFFRLNRAVLRVDLDQDTDGDGILDPDGQRSHELFFNVGSLQISDGGNLFPIDDIIFFGFTARDPARVFRFFEGGQLRLADKGPLGVLGTTNFNVVDGDGFPSDEFVGSLTPDSQSLVINAFANYQVTDWLEAYMEGKYANTQANFGFQPSFTFYQTSAVTLVDENDDGEPDPVPVPIFGPDVLGVDFTIGTDNPFLTDEARSTIQTFGQIFGLPGLGLGIRFNFDLGERTQTTDRQTARIVTGVRGDFDVGDLFHNWHYDAGFTYGRTTTTNIQRGIPLIPRLAAAVDAIALTDDILANLAEDDPVVRRSDGRVITAAEAKAGDIVCRALAMERSGQDSGFDSFAYEGCIPTNYFGPNAISPEAANWINVNVIEKAEVEQSDALFTLTGDLFESPLGAGPVSFAMGYEYRSERTRVTNDDLPRIIDAFANAQVGVGGKFHVHEGFFEVNLPVLRDKPLAEELTVHGAARFSNYSIAVGSTTTWGVDGTYRPVRDVTFRGTFSRAIRAPNIGELFQPLTQTFAQIADPCDKDNLTANPDVAANRIKNCAALGIPADWDDPRPNVSNAGFFGGNPNVKEERARSWTVGTIVTPRWIPGLTLVADYYKIKIKDAIATLDATTLAQRCVDGPTLDPTFCSLIKRAPAGAPNEFEITEFRLLFLNLQALSTRGIDFDAQYRTSLYDLVGREWGDLAFRVRGTWLDSLKVFAFQDDPEDFDQFAGLVDNPVWHFQFSTTWAWKRFGLTYTFEWQDSQWVFNKESRQNEPDLLLSKDVLATGGYGIHDIAVTYDLFDNVTLRAGVNNLADNDPPAIAERAETFDQIGRRYFVGITAQF